jgi:membrane-bound metal-dependent hydrolase YbcI (DUF457 family)
MFIFAHIFAGALLGWGLMQLTHDRRILLLCIAGSMLPDIVDKSLGLVFPVVFNGGRTLFHSLMILGIIVVLAALLIRSRFVFYGAGVAAAVLLHQVCDEMWHQPVNWLYPVLGPFQGTMIPDYFAAYFLFEISNPSEWLFMIGSVIVLAESYWGTFFVPAFFLRDSIKNGLYSLVAVLLVCTGVFLVVAGVTGTTGTVITPSYSPLPAVIAGLLFLCGAAICTRKVLTKNTALTIL